MKITVVNPIHIAGNVAPMRCKVDDHSPAEGTIRVTNDITSDENVVELNIPGLVAIVEGEPAESLTEAVADVLRTYVADVAMRDTLGRALIEKLAVRDAISEVAIAELATGDSDHVTFRDLEKRLIAKADANRSLCDQQNPDERAAARDFSLSITALEDAGIRFTRGLAGLTGVRSDVDLEKVIAAKERQRFEDEVGAKVAERAEPTDDGDGLDAGSGAMA